MAWGLALFLLSWGAAGFVFDHLAHVFIQEVPLMVFPLAWAFTAFGVWCLHRFSMDDTVASIEEVREVVPLGLGDAGQATPSAATDPLQIPDLRAHLDRLTRAAQLTERESEIFELLVRGRNARYLQEQLGITRNTVKSHIAHIYAKLSVHSQQELIDLVEQGH